MSYSMAAPYPTCSVQREKATRNLEQPPSRPSREDWISLGRLAVGQQGAFAVAQEDIQCGQGLRASTVQNQFFTASFASPRIMTNHAAYTALQGV